MLSEIKEFVKARFNDIILFIIIVLLVMLAVASGYIIGKQQLKEPIIIENSK